ncbi:MAG: arylsulfatase [Planctomycetota bacterium]
MNPTRAHLRLRTCAFFETVVHRGVTCLIAAMLSASVFVCPARGEDGTPPNILLILADDLGFSDLGCYGGEIETPVLDRLAEAGIRFSQCYNTGRCWPTRASLMTGFYAQEVRRDFLPGVLSGGAGKRPAWAVMLPEMLNQVGYRCYHTGKWHLDGDPIKAGFVSSSPNNPGRYFQPIVDDKGRKVKPLAFRDDFYVTTAMASDAVKNLREHAEHHAEKPFFQYLAFTAPHFPLHALPEDIAKYDDVYLSGWDAIRNQRWDRMTELGILETGVSRPSGAESTLGPPYHFPDAFERLGPAEVNRPVAWESLNEKQKVFQAKKMAIHAAMVDRMDREIGRVIDQLEQSGVFENTLVFFLSDNGASAEIMVRGDGHDPSAEPGSGATYLCLGPGWSTVGNTPFRRHKTWTHEGGIATPLIAHWPSGIESQGRVYRGVHHAIDIAATILDVAQASQPEDAPQLTGQSFRGALEGEIVRPKRMLWWYHDGHRAIRIGDWKAVAPYQRPWELYDLSKDRIESNDLASAYPKRLERLKAAWQSQLDHATELASGDLSPEALERAKGGNHNRGKMHQAQLDAMLPESAVIPD